MAYYCIDDCIGNELGYRNYYGDVRVNASEGKAYFEKVMEHVRRSFAAEWDGSTAREELLGIEKKAILGYEAEIEYMISKIRSCLEEAGLINTFYPECYTGISDAVYQELYGMAGMAPWFRSEFYSSPSAKIIGDRIYFMDQGKMVLQRQRISPERKEQLIRALILANQNEKTGRDYYEIYMKNGIRITIFNKNITKDDENVIIFRKYVVKDYSFEQLELMGTIPANYSGKLKEMVKEGANCAFTGEIRSGKTTFLTAWQMNEDPTLEGVLVETDPEIPIQKLMPEAPIVQLVADGEKMGNLVKSLMRSDADYFIFGEIRDGNACNTALRIAERGGKRMKVTFHINNPLDFPFTFANEVAFACGGNVNMHALRVASCFDYIFHFVNDRNTGAKILAGIYKMEADKVAETIEIQSLLLYDFEKGTWSDKPRKMTKTVYSLSTKTANDSCSIAIGECWDGAGA